MAAVVEVYSASNEPEAKLLIQRLAEHGVVARLVDGALRTAMAVQTSRRICVAEDDAERARCLLNGWDRRTGDPFCPSWECPICTAQVDEGFRICWSCERGREEWES